LGDSRGGGRAELGKRSLGRTVGGEARTMPGRGGRAASVGGGGGGGRAAPLLAKTTSLVGHLDVERRVGSYCRGGG
jgi:hypothetical protein